MKHNFDAGAAGADAASVKTGSSAEQQHILIYSEAMLASVQSQAGIDPTDMVDVAIIRQDGEIRVFYVTHAGEAEPSESAEQAVAKTLGDEAEFWAGRRLQMVRADKNDILFIGKPLDMPKEADQKPSGTAQAEFYNYDFEKCPKIRVNETSAPIGARTFANFCATPDKNAQSRVNLYFRRTPKAILT